MRFVISQNWGEELLKFLSTIPDDEEVNIRLVYDICVVPGNSLFSVIRDNGEEFIVPANASSFIGSGRREKVSYLKSRIDRVFVCSI